MIQTSAEYKEAVKNGEPQRCFFYYKEHLTLFTGENVLIGSGGVRLTEPFNQEKDLTIGQCPSASLRYVLDNQRGLLNDFAFGEHEAAIGVRIGRESYTTTDKLQVVMKNGTAIRFNDDGLFFGNSRAASQPNLDASVMIVDGQYVYLWSKQDNAWRGTISGGTVTNGREVDLNGFMCDKLEGWGGRGIYRNGNIVTEWTRGVKTVWEYVPLGVFIADRPNQSRRKTVAVNCHDRMVLFDEKLPAINYPITVLNLVKLLCQKADVTLADEHFIGAERVIETEPDDFRNATMRDVLGWVGELACANARMTRDGKLCFDWFAQTDRVVTEESQRSFDPYWYETKPIDRMVVRNYDSEADLEIGEGENGYLITNNPILRQDDTPKPKLLAETDDAPSDEQRIYDRLAGTATFHPATAELFIDPSVQAGDVLTIESQGERHTMPVYNMTMEWKGSAVTTLESTGSEKRKEIETREQRQTYSAGAAGYRRSKQNAEFFQVVAHAIVGDEEDPVEALLAITNDGFLQTVAKNDMKSIFVQTYKGFKFVGQEIVLDGQVLATELNGQDIVADSLSANACTFAHIDVGRGGEEQSYINSLEVGGLFVPSASDMYVGNETLAKYVESKIPSLPTDPSFTSVSATTAVLGGTRIEQRRWENVEINGTQYRLLKVNY